MLADPIRKMKTNPFNHHYAPTKYTDANSIKYLTGPCVVLAGPGTLETGHSRELFEKWCSDEKNGLILTGLTPKDTMADKVKNKPQFITSKSDGARIPLKLKVTTISFSAHADCNQTVEFLKVIQPEYVVLVHGHE